MAVATDFHRISLAYIHIQLQRQYTTISPIFQLIFFSYEMVLSKAEDMYDIGIGDSPNNNVKAEKNIVSHNFKSMIKVSSEVNSLSTIQGDAVISADNVIYNADYVSFNNDDEEITFYSWNDNVDTDTLDKIADSVSFN